MSFVEFHFVTVQIEASNLRLHGLGHRFVFHLIVDYKSAHLANLEVVGDMAHQHHAETNATDQGSQSRMVGQTDHQVHIDSSTESHYSE